MNMFFKKQKKKVIGIQGMHCENCALKIGKALSDLSSIDNAKVDLKKNIAIIYYDDEVDDLQIQKIIEELGYSITGIKEIR